MQASAPSLKPQVPNAASKAEPEPVKADPKRPAAKNGKSNKGFGKFFKLPGKKSSANSDGNATESNSELNGESLHKSGIVVPGRTLCSSFALIQPAVIPAKICLLADHKGC